MQTLQIPMVFFFFGLVYLPSEILSTSFSTRSDGSANSAKLINSFLLGRNKSILQTVRRGKKERGRERERERERRERE